MKIRRVRVAELTNRVFYSLEAMRQIFASESIIRRTVWRIR